MQLVCALLYDRLCDVRDRMYPIQTGEVSSGLGRSRVEEEQIRVILRYEGVSEAEILWRVMQFRYNNHGDGLHRAGDNQMDESDEEEGSDEEEESDQDDANDQNSHRAGWRPRIWHGSRVHPV